MVGQKVHDPGTEVLVEAQVLELGDQFDGDYCIKCRTVVNEQHPDIDVWVLKVG